MDNTSFSVSDNTIVDKFTTMLSPEQVLYSLKCLSLNDLVIISEFSGTCLGKLRIVGNGISIIKLVLIHGITIGVSIDNGGGTTLRLFLRRNIENKGVLL